MMLFTSEWTEKKKEILTVSKRLSVIYPSMYSLMLLLIVLTISSTIARLSKDCYFIIINCYKDFLISLKIRISWNMSVSNEIKQKKKKKCRLLPGNWPAKSILYCTILIIIQINMVYCNNLSSVLIFYVKEENISTYLLMLY